MRASTWEIWMPLNSSRFNSVVWLQLVECNFNTTKWNHGIDIQIIFCIAHEHTDYSQTDYEHCFIALALHISGPFIPRVIRHFLRRQLLHGLRWYLRQQRVRVRVTIGLLVRRRVMIKIRIRVGATFNVSVYHWSNCRVLSQNELSTIFYMFKVRAPS